MKAAISAGELAQAMAEGNNMARTAGASMNWYAGALAAVVSNTQLDSTRVGTAYRTMFSRYANVKAGKFVAGKTEQSAEGFDEADYEDLNDVEKVLGKLGIDIRSGGSFKNIESVFSQIAGRWSDFNNVEKSAIATALAGTRQREVMVATFENWNEVLSLSTTAAASYGTAEQKMEAYNDSLAASQERVTAEFEKLTMNVKMQDVLKEINNTLSFIIRNIGKLGSLLIASRLLSSLGAFTSYSMKQKSNVFNKLSRMSIFGSTGSLIKYGGKQGFENYKEVSNVMNTYAPEDKKKIMQWMQASNNVEVFGLSKNLEESITPEMKNLKTQLSSTNPKEKKIAEKMIKDLNKSTGRIALENAFGIGAQIASGLTIGFTNNIAQSFGASGEAANTIGTVVGGLSSVLASTGMIGSLASIGISLATGLWSAYIKEQEEKLKEAKEKATTLLSDYTNVVASESSVKRYDELAKGVDNLGNNVSLTDTEYQEFLDTGNKLADLFPTLILRQDAVGNSILGLDGKVGNVTDKFNQLRDAMQLSAAIAATSDTIIKDRLKSYYENLNSSKSKADTLQKLFNTTNISADEIANPNFIDRVNMSLNRVFMDDLDKISPKYINLLNEYFGNGIWESAMNEGHNFALNLSNSVFKGEELELKKNEFLKEISDELSDARQEVVKVQKETADLAIQEIIKNHQDDYNELSNTENQIVRDYFSSLYVPDDLDETGYKNFIDQEWGKISEILSNPEIDWDFLANGDSFQTAQQAKDIRQKILKLLVEALGENGLVDRYSTSGAFLIKLGFIIDDKGVVTTGSALEQIQKKLTPIIAKEKSLPFGVNPSNLSKSDYEDLKHGNNQLLTELLSVAGNYSEEDAQKIYGVLEQLDLTNVNNFKKSIDSYLLSSYDLSELTTQYDNLVNSIKQKQKVLEATGVDEGIEVDQAMIDLVVDKITQYANVLGISNEELETMKTDYDTIIKKVKLLKNLSYTGTSDRGPEEIKEQANTYAKYAQEYGNDNKFSKETLAEMALDENLRPFVAKGNYEKANEYLKEYLNTVDEEYRGAYKNLLLQDEAFNKEMKADKGSEFNKAISNVFSGLDAYSIFGDLEQIDSFLNRWKDAGNDVVRQNELLEEYYRKIATWAGINVDENDTLLTLKKKINDSEKVSLKLHKETAAERRENYKDYMATTSGKKMTEDQFYDLNYGSNTSLLEAGLEKEDPAITALKEVLMAFFSALSVSYESTETASDKALKIAQARKALIDQEWEAMKVFDENALKKIGDTAYFSKMRAALQEEKSAIYSVMNQSGTTEAERLGYLKDIQDIDKELANLDEEEIKYKLTILELENATYNERIETQKQLIKTSDTYEELLENQKALNELLKEEYENRMGILDARIELSKYQNARYSNVYSNEYDESKSAQGFYSSRKSLEDKKNNIAAEANRRREQLRSLNPKLTTEEINNKSEISDLSKEWWAVNEEQANSYGEFLDIYIQNQKTVIDREKELGRMSKEEQLSNLGDILNYMQTVYVPQTEAEQTVLNQKIDELQRESISLQKEIFNDYIASIERKISNIQITKPNEWSSVDQIKEYYNSIMREQQLLAETELKQLQDTSNWTQEEIDNLVDKYNNAQKEILNNQIELTQALTDRQESVYTALTEEVNDYIKEIEKQKEKISDAYDEEIERLNEINKAKEDSIKYTQLLQNLENAQKEKKRVFRQGIGWVYEQDRTSVKAAQDEIDKYLFDQKISDLQTAKDKEIESLQNSIDGWQDYLEALGEKHDEYEKEKREQLLFEAWGINENLSLSEKQAELYDKILLDRNDFLSEYKLGNESYSGFMTEFLEDYKANLELLEKYNKQMILLMKDIAAGGAFGNAESTANKMKANSEAWWNASDAEKERLAKENEELGSAMGWTRGSDGVWYDEDGNVAYTIDKSSATTPKFTTSTAKNTGNASNIISGISNKISEASKSIGGSFTLGSLFNKSGYSEGLEAGPVTYTGLAMLHGSEDEPEYVLTNDQAWNILRNLSSNKPKFETNSSNKENSYNFYGDFKLPGVANAAQFFKSLMSYTNRKINTTSTLTE